MVDYRSENFDLNVFLVTSNVCLDPGLVVMKILNIIDIFCGGVTKHPIGSTEARGFDLSIL